MCGCCMANPRRWCRRATVPSSRRRWTSSAIESRRHTGHREPHLVQPHDCWVRLWQMQQDQREMMGEGFVRKLNEEVATLCHIPSRMRCVGFSFCPQVATVNKSLSTEKKVLCLCWGVCFVPVVDHSPPCCCCDRVWASV